MNVGKKVDRFRQYAREKMGGEVATTSTDEFKGLEIEMDLRHQGMERLQQSANAYIKSMSKRDQGEKQEKQIPVGHFGSTLVSHGDDFEPDSEFGQCLLSLGRANERIARVQETYCANATTTWLESVERSMIQMKEYQAARKKLESRRLAFDTASGKMQKSKKEDYRMEEELRSQKAKYEESQEEVYRRMLDIKEAEADSVEDLSSFLEAELQYHDRCREILIGLKKTWPATLPPSRSDNSSPINGLARRATRSRESSIADRSDRNLDNEPLEPPVRPIISSRASSSNSVPVTRPQLGRSMSGFEGPTSVGREYSPPTMPRIARAPTDPTLIQGAKNGLRVTKREMTNGNVYVDYASDRSESPPMSDISRTSSMQGQDGSVAKRPPPPPPPPSRATKPKPPPPPPMKRSALSTSEVPRY